MSGVGRAAAAWPLTVAAGLALAAGAGALVLLVAVVFPSSSAAARLSRILPLPDVHAARALDMGRRAVSARDPVLAAAQRETRQEMMLAPLRPAPHVRLAYFETMAAGGRWTPSAERALARSYQLAPLDREVGIARIRLIFDHWSEVDAAWREQALAEQSALWNQTGLKPQLRANAASVNDPKGQLAAVLQIARLERVDGAKLAQQQAAP